MTAAREAYDKLPLAERRAIQDNMVWAGFYKGIVDGEFGRMTFSSMRTFTSRRPGAAAGILLAPDRAALAAEAGKARVAAGFAILSEPRAGFALGIPQKIFVRRADAGSGARFETADKSAGVETFRLREGEVTLQSLYETYRAPAPNRRVTYSIIRPEFFVVTAETPARASYTRVARGTAAGEAQLRGFSISWPKAQQARFEILSVAIANSFDPFNQRASVASADPKAAGGAVKAPAIVLPPAGPLLASTSVAFAPNRYLAILPSPQCADARIGQRPARLMRHDPATGLALFDVPGGTGTRLRTPAQAAGSDEQAAIIFAAPGEIAGTAFVTAGAGEVAEIAEASQVRRVRAAIPPDMAGGLVISRKGGLLGLVAPVPAAARRVAGAPPPASRELLRPESIGAFLAASGLEFVPAQAVQNGPPLSLGKIAADSRGSIEALWCLPAGGR